MTEIPKPFAAMTLAELQIERASFEALLSQTYGGSARAAVAGVCDLLSTWIAKREREAMIAMDYHGDVDGDGALA